MVDSTIIWGMVFVQNNLTGCNNVGEIHACSSCLVSTSETEIIDAQLSVFPNPAEDILRFQLDSSRDELIDFALENSLGQRLLMGQTATNQREAVDVSGLAAGLYLLRVWREGEATGRLFIKE